MVLFGYGLIWTWFYLGFYQKCPAKNEAHSDTHKPAQPVHLTSLSRLLRRSSVSDFGRRRELPHDDGETTPSLHLLEDVTSVWTTIVAIVHALWLMIRIRPQVILCNGPGTCIALCVIAFLFKVLGIRWSSIFYVESVARVKNLSLSGLLLYKLRMADQFFVQWPQLQKNYPRAHYVGCLM